MLKFLRSPLVRISFGLVMLTVSMLVVSDMLGIVPDTRSAELESRKVITESLAVQLSAVIAEDKLDSVEETLRSVVERNASVLSGGIRKRPGTLLVDIGEHYAHWTLAPGDRSTTSQLRVPLFDHQGRWGTVELRFDELDGRGDTVTWQNSFFSLIALVAVSGFVGYLLFLKRTMRELDPSAVIPERVRQALDTLNEGLLIVDNGGLIVFSNRAFAGKIGLAPEDMVGKQSADLQWEVADSGSGCSRLPWLCLLDGMDPTANTSVKLTTGLRTKYEFTVNASPITSATGAIRGVLVTFADMTEIEKKNEELHQTLERLERSQREIMRQNQQLHVLATRDPLTGVLNRRSLFQGFAALFSEAREGMEDLACIMVDIDHFKSVNDRFGHAVGDKVIKLMANVLSEYSRPNDLVGRFGGEEFCVALPGVAIDGATAIAERMRLAIQEGKSGKLTSAVRITASFGVSDLTNGANSVPELVDRSDKALYAAKQSGRNRVVGWTTALADAEPNDAPEPAALEQAPVLGQPGPDPQTSLATPDSPQPHADDEPGTPTGEVVELRTRIAGDELAAKGRQPDQGAKLEASESTHPPNVIVLFDRLEQAMRRCNRYKTGIAVMAIDIEALERVNATLGFSVGEKFAKTIITRLKRMLRSTDTVSLTEEDELPFSISHFGRSEIVVLLTDLKQTDIVTIILQRLFNTINEPVEVQGTEFFLDSDVGVSLYPVDGEDAETLLSHANSAMREAGQLGGRNNFRFFSAELNRRSREQMRIETDLHRALEREEFVVYYQPKVDLKTGEILGMEALLRWRHPRLGLVPPNDFIPIAEHSGLIDRISPWIIKTVCLQILAWRHAGFPIRAVAVNLSAVEFRNRELGEQIVALLEETGLPASALEIEITETVVMQNMETAIDILTRLNDAGVRISVDDFGTGYSSLSYLKQFPLSRVKIDRSFISDFTQGPNDAAIVSAIIAMSHSLGLTVVAEGVETDEQLRFLQDLQCDEIQGYLVSKPLPCDEISELLSRKAGIRNMIMDSGNPLSHSSEPRVGAGVFGILNEFPATTRNPARPRARMGETQ